jgi:hypothetical protein
LKNLSIPKPKHTLDLQKNNLQTIV